jgi:hypothetical protein
MGEQAISLAARVFNAVKELGGEVTTTAIFDRLCLQTRAAEKTALNALSDMTRTGRVLRVRQGVYTIPAMQGVGISKQERMWRVIRARRRVTVADLQELADVTGNYAKEYLLMLSKHSVMLRQPQPKNRPHVWVLINDPVIMPENKDKAARLRASRLTAKSAALQALDQAGAAINLARQTVNDLAD